MYRVCMVCENFRVSVSVLILWHAMARPTVAKTDCCSYGYERHGTPSRAISLAKYHCVRMIRLHIWDSVSCPISFVARSVHAGSIAISLILSNLSCAVLVFLLTCPRYRLDVFGCRQRRKVLQPELSVNYTRKLTTFLLLHLEIYVTLRPQRPYGLLGGGELRTSASTFTQLMNSELLRHARLLVYIYLSLGPCWIAEEKGEPKRIRTEALLLTRLTPYRLAKPVIRLPLPERRNPACSLQSRRT